MVIPSETILARAGNDILSESMVEFGCSELVGDAAGVDLRCSGQL